MKQRNLQNDYKKSFNNNARNTLSKAKDNIISLTEFIELIVLFLES